MAELNTLLNDVHTNLETKIKELYEKKLKEHMENISLKLSDAYTKDYGQLYFNSKQPTYEEQLLYKLSLHMKQINSNIYIVHKIKLTFTQNNQRYGYSIIIFDNYGNNVVFMNLDYNKNPLDYNIFPLYNTKKHNFICPDILINLIKSLEDNYHLVGECYQYEKLFGNFLKQIQLLAEDYYNRFMIDKPLVEENKKLIEENDSLKKSLIKSTNEIGTQTEIINDIKVVIENNVLTIFYYNQDELNLCDFLPKLTKDIEKDGRTITINYTNIERVCIICSDFKKITKYYQGIKHIQLFQCKNFERIPHYLKKDLEYFTIDGKNQL
jgi:hypothetical protein